MMKVGLLATLNQSSGVAAALGLVRGADSADEIDEIACAAHIHSHTGLDWSFPDHTLPALPSSFLVARMAALSAASGDPAGRYAKPHNLVPAHHGATSSDGRFYASRHGSGRKDSTQSQADANRRTSPR